MSLKAKLEAVIYAAEEPVTLAQLTALFAAEALEWKAEQEAASAAQDAEAAQPPLLLPEEFAYTELEPIPAESVPAELVSEPVDQAVETHPEEAQPEASPETGVEAAAEPSTDAATEPSEETAAEATPETGSAEDPAEAAPADAEAAPAAEESAASEDAAEAEARRQARQREREARTVIRQLLDELIASCASDGRGVEIREIAGGYRVATKPECHDAVRLFVRSLKAPLKLSLPALETLAVIAYKQPVTAPEVNEIRGVDSSGVFGSLLARKLIATAGRKQVIGRPILYKTTREFLLRFGLKDVSELPSMEEFEKMAALELEEPESAAGEDSEQKPNPALGPEFDEAASEELEDQPTDELDNQTEAPESPETAETAVSNEPPPPEEAAPAAPPATEQAETETLPHGEEKD
jgi:segregation and condensation protein B